MKTFVVGILVLIAIALWTHGLWSDTMRRRQEFRFKQDVAVKITELQTFINDK